MTLDGKTTPGPDALPAEQGRPSGGEGSNPSSTPNTPKTFTQEEVDRIVNERHAELDRRLAAANKEIETFKSQLETNQGLIKETQSRIERLNSEIDELSADDPDKQKLTKKLRDLEELESKLKEDRRTLEAEKLNHAEAVKKAQDFSLKETCTRIASEFKNGNADKLKAICAKRSITDEADIRELAETFWEKSDPPKSESKEKAPITPVDGVTAGGVTDEEFMKQYGEGKSHDHARARKILANLKD